MAAICYDEPMTIADIPPWAVYIFAGIFGSLLGSFANVCILRMPAGRSVVRPRSACPLCGHRLSWWENIPILSFIVLHGRCRSCRGHISWQYPLIELLCATLAVAVWWRFGQPLEFFVYLCLLIVPLVIVSFIDLKHRIIPDSISIPGIFVGVGAAVLLSVDGARLSAAIDSVLGAVVGGLTLFLVATAYEKLKKQEGLGGGDIKLIAMLGAFFGWRASIFILLVSSVLGSLVGLVMILVLRKDMKYAIPFGPFLAAAGIIYLFFGPRLILWYLGLIG